MGSINPLIIKDGTTGSVFSSAPALSPKYQVQGNNTRLNTMARLGVSSIPTDAIFRGDFERYRAALEGNGYIVFLLQSAVENFAEIVQVDVVLGDTYVPWFYGQRAPVFVYGGILLNTQQDKWRSAMRYLYSDVFRGSKLAKNRMLVRLQYDSVLVEGALIGMTQSMNAENETAAQFNFQILVKQFVDLDPPSPTSLPVLTSSEDTIIFAPLEDVERDSMISPTLLDSESAVPNEGGTFINGGSLNSLSMSGIA